MSDNQAIEEFYIENRTFPPQETFASKALLNNPQIYNEASEDYVSFWARQARELLTWDKDFTNTLEWNLPYAKWFSDGELNISYNCLDRHIENGKGDKVAYHWEGEPGDTQTITYQELLDEVSKFANVLKQFGLKKNNSGASVVDVGGNRDVSALTWLLEKLLNSKHGTVHFTISIFMRKNTNGQM